MCYVVAWRLERGQVIWSYNHPCVFRFLLCKSVSLYGLKKIYLKQRRFRWGKARFTKYVTLKDDRCDFRLPFCSLTFNNNFSPLLREPEENQHCSLSYLRRKYFVGWGIFVECSAKLSWKDFLKEFLESEATKRIRSCRVDFKAFVASSLVFNTYSRLKLST